MSNAKLIAEARTFAASYQREGMPLVADMITRVTDALEVADSRLWMVEEITLGLDYAHDHARIQALTLLFGGDDE